MARNNIMETNWKKIKLAFEGLTVSLNEGVKLKLILIF